MTQTFFPEIFFWKSQKNYFEFFFFQFFFFQFFFVLTDHFNSKYMFYNSFGLNSWKKKFHFIKKIFPQKFEVGGILIMPKIVDFLQWRWSFGRKWPNRPNYFFRPPQTSYYHHKFFFKIDWIVVEECLFKVWKSKNRKKWFARGFADVGIFSESALRRIVLFLLS